jgi:O-antigen/teichoic acid export membrane protein
MLILGMLGGQVLGILGNWTYAFGWEHPGLFPSWAYWDFAGARKIMGAGAMFFILQLCAVSAIPLDNIVITQILGPAAVTQYAVPMRLFILVLTIATMFLLPLWPAYGEAFARGDLNWVKSTFYHSLTYNILIFGPICLGLAAFGKLLVHIWVGNQIQPTFTLLMGMACWAILAVFIGAITVLLNGLNRLKFQVMVTVPMAFANIGLKIVMAKFFGLPGVIYAAAIVVLVTTVAEALYAHRILTRTAVFRQG